MARVKWTCRGHRTEKDLYRREGEGRRCLLGTEFIQFLAALAILHQDDRKKRMNCTRTIFWCKIAIAFQGIEFILFPPNNMDPTFITQILIPKSGYSDQHHWLQVPLVGNQECQTMFEKVSSIPIGRRTPTWSSRMINVYQFLTFEDPSHKSVSGYGFYLNF